MGWKFVLSLIFALIVAIFAIQNATVVDVRFFVKDISISQALIVLISAVFGAAAVFLLGLVAHVKLKSIIRGDKKEISALQNENQELSARLEQIKMAEQTLKEEAPVEIVADQQL